MCREEPFRIFFPLGLLLIGLGARIGADFMPSIGGRKVHLILKTAMELTADYTDDADDAEEEGLGFLPRILPGLTHWVSALSFTNSA